MDKVFIIEIDDAKAEVVGSLWNDTINERLYPGEGELDTAEFVKAIYQAGWRGHWGVEILAESHRKLPLATALTRAREAALKCLNDAEQLLTQEQAQAV